MSINKKFIYIPIQTVADILDAYRHKKPVVLCIRELSAFILYALLVLKFFNNKDSKLKKSSMLGIYVQFYRIQLDSRGCIVRTPHDEFNNIPYGYHIEIPYRNMLKKNEDLIIEHLDKLFKAEDPLDYFLRSNIELIDWKMTIDGKNIVDKKALKCCIHEYFKITGKSLKPKFTPFKFFSKRAWLKTTLSDYGKDFPYK